MIRPMSLSLVLATGLGLCACAQPTKPTQSFIDVARAPSAANALPVDRIVMDKGIEQGAFRVEQGRILEVRAGPDQGFAYIVQRLRDDSVIEVDQFDARPLPTGLKVYISYGSSVRIEAAPSTPDLG